MDDITRTGGLVPIGLFDSRLEVHLDRNGSPHTLCCPRSEDGRHRDLAELWLHRGQLPPQVDGETGLAVEYTACGCVCGRLLQGR